MRQQFDFIQTFSSCRQRTLWEFWLPLFVFYKARIVNEMPNASVNMAYWERARPRVAPAITGGSENWRTSKMNELDVCRMAICDVARDGYILRTATETVPDTQRRDDGRIASMTEYTECTGASESTKWVSDSQTPNGGNQSETTPNNFSRSVSHSFELSNGTTIIILLCTVHSQPNDDKHLIYGTSI